MVANLYLREGVVNPPVVIISRAWTTVKEQMPTVYAETLVKKGYAVVTFDFRSWGQSADLVRFMEDPGRKTVDIAEVIGAVAKMK